MRDGYGTRATEASLRPPSGASRGRQYKWRREAAGRSGEQKRQANTVSKTRQAVAASRGHTTEKHFQIDRHIDRLPVATRRMMYSAVPLTQ